MPLKENTEKSVNGRLGRGKQKGRKTRASSDFGHGIALRSLLLVLGKDPSVGWVASQMVFLLGCITTLLSKLSIIQWCVHHPKSLGPVLSKIHTFAVPATPTASEFTLNLISSVLVPVP